MKSDVPFWAWFDTVTPFLANRLEGYEKMFKHLDELKRPVTIIETGCMRRDPLDPAAWTGDGCSTMLFDRYVQHSGGKVYSVDINAEHVAGCREIVSDMVDVHLGDSVARLAELVATGVKPDLVYLDSFDRIAGEPFETALHTAKEFEAIKPALTDETLVVIDDTLSVFVPGTVMPTLEVNGKGAFVWQYAKSVGAETLFAGNQVGWTHMVGARHSAGEYDEKLWGRSNEVLDEDIRKLVERARAAVETKRNADADAAYRAVMMATKPPKSGLQRVARGEACAFYGRLAAAVGMYGTACDWYRDAIIADPRCVEYRLELVQKGHAPMLNFQLAKQEAQRCTLLEPDNAEAWRTLGETEMSLCDARESRKCFERQLEILPDDSFAMLDLCVLTLDMADYETTKRLADKILFTDRRADGIHVLAMIANREGRHEDAIKLFDEALQAGCNNKVITHWNKSLSLLALGRYREGWIEQEWRKEELRNPALSLSFQRFVRPLYEGQPAEVEEADGTRRKAILLIHAEAGMGDNIIYSRFLRDFVAKGFDVRYEGHPDMCPLIQRSFPEVEVVERAPDYPGSVGIKNFDYHLPLGSLPYTLGTDYDTVPAYDSYLTPDAELVVKYGDALKDGREPRVGFCWSSGIREYGLWIAEYGRRKSMHFDTMGPVVDAAKAAGALAVNLQVGPERMQHGGRVFEALPAKPNWDDTAALIANLDLIVTVDTAVAHLAGALGKPTWLVMQQDGASFHFMTERPGALWNEASPWYPSVRIFRQNKPGDWSGVIERVAGEVSKCSQT